MPDVTIDRLSWVDDTLASLCASLEPCLQSRLACPDNPNNHVWDEYADCQVVGGR